MASPLAVLVTTVSARFHLMDASVIHLAESMEIAAMTSTIYVKQNLVMKDQSD
jgi:hypothetical protein